MNSKPRILILALGGTIAMTPSPEGGITPRLSAADLIAAVPGLNEIADVVARSPLQLPGASLTMNDLISVAKLIADSKAEAIDGAVVVQGTDTIEETAFVLDCLDTGSIPVVVTGAMRGPQSAGADGPGNLLAAVIVAASPAASMQETFVVLNDTVHFASFVRKGHTALPSSFTSEPYGPAGYVVEGEFVRIAPPRVVRFPALRPSRLVPPVAIVTFGLGDDGRLTRVLPELGYKGAIIAGMGVGHVPQAAIEPITELAKLIPTVLASRVPEGPTLKNTYGFPGSERDMLARGLISSGWLQPTKARLLLSLLLATEAEKNIAAAFMQRCTPL